MKRILIPILMLFLSISAMGQKSENKVNLGQYQFQYQSPAVPGVVNAFDRLVIEQEVRDQMREELNAAAAAACDERELAIEKMKLEIDCRGITADELGFPQACDTLGLYSEWIVRYCDPRKSRGSHLTWLDPATPLTGSGRSGTQRDHALVGFNKFVPIGTRVYMSL